MLTVSKPFQALKLIHGQINLRKSCVCARVDGLKTWLFTVTEQPVCVSVCVFLKAVQECLRVGTEHCQPRCRGSSWSWRGGVAMEMA